MHPLALLLIPALVLLAPLFVAVSAPSGGTGWKICTGIFCGICELLAMASMLYGAIFLVAAVILWVVAMATAAAAWSAGARAIHDREMLAAIRHQNELLAGRAPRERISP